MEKVIIVETCHQSLWDHMKASKQHEIAINRRLNEPDNLHLEVANISTTSEPTVIYFGGNDKTTVPKYRSVILLKKSR